MSGLIRDNWIFITAFAFNLFSSVVSLEKQTNKSGLTHVCSGERGEYFYSCSDNCGYSSLVDTKNLTSCNSLKVIYNVTSETIFKNTYTLLQGSVNFFCKGSDSKYFLLCRPWSFCYNGWSRPVQLNGSLSDTHTQGCGCIAINKRFYRTLFEISFL